MKRPIKILLAVLCLIFLCIFGYSGYQLYTTFHEYKVAEEMYDGMSNQFVSQSTKTPIVRDSLDPLAFEEHSPISVDFDALTATNSDVVGWIYSEDTVINYPIARAEDNAYYLHRFIDGTYNPNGTLFVDYLCNGDFSSKNTLVYGHNMNDGSMFASLRKYVDQEYYDAHPKLYLNTPEQNYRIELFAGYITDADSETYTISWADESQFLPYIDRMKAQSTFRSDVEVAQDDLIITLSTCSYEYYDARYVVQGKLVPIN